MANIPKPSCFPIHGVSNDPEFYKKTYWVKGFEYDKKEINYFKPCPMDQFMVTKLMMG